MKEKVVFCWSGGKDSALALDCMLRDERYQVVSLLTTCNRDFRRVSMHGVRIELLDAQAESIGLPLEKVLVETRSTNKDYERAMEASLREHQRRGVTACAFGDIFLEDLRQWREANLARVGLRGIFPIWKGDTRKLVREFLAKGFSTVICCASDAYLGADAVGRTLTEEHLASFPADVDPCGENGEFHSFAYAGPIFRQPIRFTVGETIYRPLPPGLVDPTSSPPGRVTRGFWYCDLLPDGPTAPTPAAGGAGSTG
jgi:uncharacterized protein (TIGR00290 family)